MSQRIIILQIAGRIFAMVGYEVSGGDDGTRTRDLRRDRPAF